MTNPDPPPIPPAYNEADLLKTREQGRGQQHAYNNLVATKFAEQQHTERMWALNALKDYGQNTIRALTLLNGGAILSLLTFVGSVVVRNEDALSKKVIGQIVSSFYLYGAGLILAAVISGLAYVNFSAVAVAYYDSVDINEWLHGRKPVARAKWLPWVINATVWIPVALAVVSVTLFGWGSYRVGSALTQLGSQP